jgi:hypothetical protein
MGARCPVLLCLNDRESHLAPTPGNAPRARRIRRIGWMSGIRDLIHDLG